jgi:uncharacterized protein YeeX (DUF496 family)
MLIDNTLKQLKKDAYVEGWQDAVSALTKEYEDRLRSVIDKFELPKEYEITDDNTQEPQG